MAKKLHNLTMSASGHMVGVAWATDPGTEKEARWHVWLKIDSAATAARHHDLPSLPVSPYAVRDPDKGLRKNPPVAEVRYRGRTGAWLDATTKANAPMVQQALAEAERLGLYQIAVDKAAADEQARVDSLRDEQAAKMDAAVQQLVIEGLPGAVDFALAYGTLSQAERQRVFQIMRHT